MRTIRTYPTDDHPHASGEVYYDDESDSEVVYIHYRDFIKPGLTKRINAVVAVERASGKSHVVDGDQESIDELKRNAETAFLKRVTADQIPN